MSKFKTTNLNLNKWDSTDKVLVTEINDNFSKLDSEVGKAVKSINGVTPDKNGNVVVGGAGGGFQTVFQTLAELEAAYPNGINQKVFVIDENADYYWDGVITGDTTAPVLTITPNEGTYNANQTVTMSANETADIYYTLDGSTPTTASTKYTAPITISATTTVKAFAKDTAGNSSTVQTKVFTIDKVAPTVTASPLGGTYATVQNVTLTANEQATIYYTTDGSTPTVSSSVYSSPININATKTLKYFAKDTAGNSSTVQSQAYTLNLTDTDPPLNVTNLKTTGKTDTSISLSWTASTSNDVVEYTIEHFEVGVEDTTPPEPVSNLTVTGKTSNSISVSWNPSPSSDVSSYDVTIAEI